MTGPQHRAAPRGDDDSWGKLANELLGINLDADEDLDFSDLEPPPLATPTPPPPEAPAVPRVESIDLSDMNFEGPEESTTEIGPPHKDEPSLSDDAAVESTPTLEEDDFWNALESWDWETSEEGPKEPERRSGRPEQRGPEKRSTRREFREERPPRAESPRSRPAQRKEARAEPRREAREPRRTSPPRSVPVDDDFGAGVVEELEESSWETLSARTEPSFPQETEPDDFEEPLEEEADLEFEREREERTEEETPRRRRRRRRRRRGGDRREELSSLSREASSLEEEPLREPREIREEEEAEALEREPRERRRRRRRRSEPEDLPVAGENLAEEVEGPEEDELAEESEESVVRPMNYENIPTWEEAISYLLRPRGERPRRRSG